MGIIMGLPPEDRHPDVLLKKAHRANRSPIIVNEIGLTDEDLEVLSSRVVKELTNSLEKAATCKCGRLKDPSGILPPDTVCNKCGASINVNGGDQIDPVIFMRKAPMCRPWIRPSYWFMLRKNMDINRKFNALDWLTDTSYRGTHPDFERWMESVGFERGYNNFVDNLDEYLPLLTAKITKTESKPILAFREKYGDGIYSNHIALVDSTLLVIEANSTGKYHDKTLPILMDAVHGYLGIDNTGQTAIAYQNIMSRTLTRLSEYYDKYFTANLRGKTGGIRSNLCSTRPARIARMVITSISGTHDHEYVVIPWAAGIYTLAMPIYSVLMKKGYSLDESMSMIQYALSGNYNKVIADIMDDLVKKSNKGRMTCLCNRFPTLKRSGLIFEYFKEISKDVNSYVLKRSVLTCPGPNADFDGDNMGMVPFFEGIYEDMLEGLRYYNNILANDEPRETAFLTLGTPVNINISTWMDHADRLDETLSQSQLDKILKLAG